MRGNNAIAILEPNTQAVPAVLGEYPVAQAVHTPALVQVVQLVIVEQAPQVFPSVVLGKYESEQAVHTPARVQVVQLVIRVGQST